MILVYTGTKYHKIIFSLKCRLKTYAANLFKCHVVNTKVADYLFNVYGYVLR